MTSRSYTAMTRQRPQYERLKPILWELVIIASVLLVECLKH